LACSTLSAADVQKLRQQFHAIDTDNTGTITFQELSEACQRSGMEAEKVRNLMKEIDTDGDGTINYSEFIVATTDVRRPLPACLGCFCL
jgi:calcium-dependent protein kinase